MESNSQPKQNSTTSYSARIIILLILLCILSSCGVVVQAPLSTESVNLVSLTPENTTVEKPTDTPTPESTATLTPQPTPTATPEIELVDGFLAEEIRRLMPKMWFYNDVSKILEVRNPDEFTFLISKKTKLLIFDKDGNEVGFANYFVKTSPDANITDYFSLTDISKDTVIPLRLYSQMGDYTAKLGIDTTKQCMFRFVEEFTEFRPNRSYEQIAVDVTQEYAPDSRNIQKGEKMVETAILRVLANITNVSEENLFEDLQKGLSMEFETNRGKWVVNKGVNYTWSDSDHFSYDLVDGELFLYSGFADTDLANDAIDGCRPMAWDVGFRSFLGGNFTDEFPDVIPIYLANAQPYLDRYTRQTPVIVDLREY